MAQRKKWDPGRMKEVIEAVRNKEMGNKRRPGFSAYPKQH
jgi:hypothetical protein